MRVGLSTERTASRGQSAKSVAVPAVLLSCLLALGAFKYQLGSRLTPEPITLPEAEILIYFLPQAVELRSQGMEVGWELTASPKVNHEDFFSFWVINVTRESAGSVTVGWFFVNRHTGDVWDDGLGKYVVSHDIEGIQKILRRAHRIDEETLRRYRTRSPYVPVGPMH